MRVTSKVLPAGAGKEEVCRKRRSDAVVAHFGADGTEFVVGGIAETLNSSEGSNDDQRQHDGVLHRCCSFIAFQESLEVCH